MSQNRTKPINSLTVAGKPSGKVFGISWKDGQIALIQTLKDKWSAFL
jgi:hypothetical protein